MALIDKTVPYEILIRFDENGDLAAGHYQERRIVILDGERLQDQPGNPVPLGLAPEEAMTTLSDALGDALAPALKAATAEMARADLAEQRLEQALTERDELARKLETLVEKLRIVSAARAV